jgi:hypothetical protein
MAGATTSKYFNNYSQRSRTGEQQLVDDLLNEAIVIYGTDLYYIVRESEDRVDMLFGEDPLAYFQRAYAIPMYIEDIENYRGEGEFLSKFGLEARQGANFIVTQTHFNRCVPQNLIQRPREGDLIWVPIFGKMFEIKFVDKDKNFYQLGRRDPYFWEIYTEMWKFSQNKVSTGIEDIDDVKYIDSATIRYHMDTSGGTTEYAFNETLFQGTNLGSATATGTLSGWNRLSGNLDIIHIKGVFAANANIVGASSNTSYRITSYDNQENVLIYDTSDNQQLQSEGNNITNFTETNPWGVP